MTNARLRKVRSARRREKIHKLSALGVPVLTIARRCHCSPQWVYEALKTPPPSAVARANEELCDRLRSSGMPPAEIAAASGLPVADVRRILRRLGSGDAS